MADGILTLCNVGRSWHWFRQVTAPCSVACGSGMTFHWIRPNVRHIGILHLVSISTISPRSQHVILHQSAKFYRNRTTLGRKKITSCRFSRWRISGILNFMGPIMGSLKSRCTTSYRSSIATIAQNCLVFEKIVFFVFWRQTDRQTDGHHWCTKPLWLSRATA